jgi:hypothetical protein
MLRPDVDRPLTYAWGAFAGALLLAGLAWWWFRQDGGLGRQLAGARQAFEQREGDSPVRLQREVERQRQANRELSETIERIKDQVGIAPIDPFVIPKRYENQRRFYFNMIFEATRNTLYERAVQRAIRSYEPELGFGRGQIEDGDVMQELIRLQLIAKAMVLALSTEDSLAAISVEHGPIEQTGPKDRPPLLVEYGFSLRVRGRLKDILWLLHQLGVEEPQAEIVRGLNGLFTTVQRLTEGQVRPLDEKDFFPLIVRGLEVRSGTLQARDDIAMLEVRIDLAGMEFLSAQERAQGGRAKDGTDGGSARAPGGGIRRVRGRAP